MSIETTPLPTGTRYVSRLGPGCAVATWVNRASGRLRSWALTTGGLCSRTASDTRGELGSPEFLPVAQCRRVLKPWLDGKEEP